MDRIISAIKNNEWEKRLPALKTAREQVLNQISTFSSFSNADPVSSYGQ